MKREVILKELYGGLWHTTHPDRFQSILTIGAILPEPNIHDKERHKMAGGAEHYPFARSLGGVSLFDFNQFDPKAYESRCPSSSWAYFVPYSLTWDRAVWIEIDREQVAEQLISGAALLARWNADKAYGHTIMPEIEAAHIGPLPTTAFKRALLVCKEDDEFHAIDWR